VTLKTYPDLPIAFAELTVPETAAKDSLNDMLATYIEQVPHYTKLGIYINILYFLPGPSLSAPLIVWYNHTQAELDEVMQPWVSQVQNITENSYKSKVYPSFIEMYKDQDGTQNTEIAVDLWGGRLVPDSLFHEDASNSSAGNGKLAEVFDFYVAQNISFFHTGFQLPKVEDPDRTAVTDAWRGSQGLVVPFGCVKCWLNRLHSHL
jgi:hypothetical protein